MNSRFSDQQIIDLCLSGDSAAFTILVRRYQDLVFAMGYRATRSAPDAEDLAQEVFIRVYRNLGSFQRDALFRPWLYRITANRIMSFLARRAASREISTAEPPDRPSPEPAPDEAAHCNRVTAILVKEIEQLPEHYRAVMTMWFLMGMTYQEIAEALGKPIGTIRAHLFRARKCLKDRQKELLLQLAPE